MDFTKCRTLLAFCRVGSECMAFMEDLHFSHTILATLLAFSNADTFSSGVRLTCS